MSTELPVVDMTVTAPTAVTRPQIAPPEDYAMIGLPGENALRALKAFCRSLVGTPFLPKSLVRDQDVDQQAGTLMAVVLTGREMSMSPMQSLRAFWLSPDGRLGMYADGMMALMLKTGATFAWKQLNNEGAILITTRGKNTYTSEFTIEDAKRAGLWTKDKSIWPKYPRNMCRSRVLGDTFRTLFPDLGGASVYTQEEVMDMEPDDAGTYTSPRQAAEAEADAKAEADPKLAVTRKPKPAADANTTRLSEEERSTNPIKATSEDKERGPVKEMTLDQIAADPAAAIELGRAALDHIRTTTLDVSATPDSSISTGLAENQAKAEPAEIVKPADPAPQAADPKAQLQALFVKIQEVIGPDSQATKLLNHFYLGYFGTPDKRKDVLPADFIKAVENVLTAITLSHDMKAAFTADAEQFGKELRALSVPASKEPEPTSVAPAEAAPEKAEPTKKRGRPAAKAEDKPAAETAPDPLCAQFNWDATTAAIARKAQAARKMPDDRFITTLSQLKVSDLPEVDAASLLLLYGFSYDAMLLKVKANEKGMPWRDVVAMVNRDFKGIVTLDSDVTAVSRSITNTLTEILSA